MLRPVSPGEARRKIERLEKEPGMRRRPTDIAKDFLFKEAVWAADSGEEGFTDSDSVGEFSRWHHI